jgi:ABC-2 type transport system ATP-binding protein
MKTILGLLKADSGEIIVNGEKVVYGETSTNQYIGYLPDVPEFYSFMTALEYLRFCGEITGMKKAECDFRSKELLELVGLGDEKHRIKGFSRGMKQRLGIAQALLNRPKLLICDEPTSALDPVGRKEILDILLTVREQTTVLFSTHILSDVERICTDVAFLNNGRIEIQGKLSDIKTKYRSEEYLMESENDTDTRKLIHAFPEMKQLDKNQLSFSERIYSSFDVLRVVSDEQIPLLRFERVEPTLETLFMEVTGE